MVWDAVAVHRRFQELGHERRLVMKKLTLAIAISMFALGSAMAQETCQSKAVGRDGKPLAGAALKSFMTKCTKDACEPKAIDKNGKPLAGAAKASFMKKCESEA
jgi:hypothetical protein